MKKLGGCLVKSVKYIFYGYLAIMLIGSLLENFDSLFGADDKPVQVADGFTIEDYFYDILPYTYVLNISKKWIDKFENIPIPKQDMGTLNYYNDRSYYLIYSGVEYPYTSGGGSSSRCSSCGGGSSSSGGGCSSCGGGGSW